MLQKAGGLFQLLAEVDFGTGFGVKSLYYKSRTANVADSGQIRLARADVINFRNQANSANLSLGVSASNNLQFNGSDLVSAAILSDYVLKSLYSAKGSILAATAAGTPADLPVGTNGFVLSANSGTSTGLEWVAAGAGDVIGPASATDNGFVRYDGTTGKLIKNSAATIVNADVSASAAIAYSKLAALTTGRALVSDGSGVVSVSATTATEIGYVNGVTSGIQAQLNGKQDPIGVSDTNSINMTLTSGTTVSADLNLSTANPDAGALNALVSIESDGLQVQVPAASYWAPQNFTLAVSFAANAMTIAVKNAAGNNPTAASPALIPVRSNSATSGSYEVVAITGALSLVVPSGATLGLNSGGACPVYVSIMNNGGTAELAVNSQWLQDGVIDTTAIDTNSDTAGYFSTAARSTLGNRMVARIDFSSAPNGTWGSCSKVSLGDDGDLKSTGDILSATSNTATPGASGNYPAFTTNSLTLQPGFWELSGEGGFGNGGSNPTYSTAAIIWCSANGANTGVQPATLGSATGLTIISGFVNPVGFGTPGTFSGATAASSTQLSTNPIVVYVDRSVTIYLVARAQMTTAANARLSVALTATKIY